MTKKEFQFNCLLTVMLSVACMVALLVNKFAEAKSDLYVQIVLLGFLVFLIFRVIVPLVFTYMDKFLTAKMQQNFRSHPLGKFFLINWDQ